MKFLMGALALAALTVLSHYLLPWWGFVLMAMLVGFVAKLSALPSFLCGFLTLLLVWGVQTWWIDAANEGVLLGRMAELLQMGSATRLWWITLLLGALLGGLAMLSGRWGYALLPGAEQSRSGSRSKYRNRFK